MTTENIDKGQTPTEANSQGHCALGDGSAPFWIPVHDEMERETHFLFLSRAEGDWSWEVWGGYFSTDGEWVVMPDHSRLDNRHLEPIFYASVDAVMHAPVSLLPNNLSSDTSEASCL